MLAVLPAPFRADTLALWKLVRDWRPSVLHGWQDRSALSCGIVTTLEPVDRLVMSARKFSAKPFCGPANRSNFPFFHRCRQSARIASVPSVEPSSETQTSMAGQL